MSSDATCRNHPSTTLTVPLWVMVLEGAQELLVLLKAGQSSILSRAEDTGLSHLAVLHFLTWSQNSADWTQSFPQIQAISDTPPLSKEVQSQSTRSNGWQTPYKSLHPTRLPLTQRIFFYRPMYKQIWWECGGRWWWGSSSSVSDPIMSGLSQATTVLHLILLILLLLPLG